MPYWEFLIQRENDRAWRPLTSRNLQVFEGNYRIIANTSMSNSAVQTQIFYQTDQKSPQISQNHTQVISNEGLLVVLPFTHIQTGTWQLNCHVTTAQDSDIHEQLCLEVVPRPGSTPTNTETAAVSPVAAPVDPSPEKPSIAEIHDHYPLVIDDLDPKQIMTSSIADLDTLLTEIAPPPPRPPEPIAQQLIQSPEEDVLDLSTISIEKITAEQSDPLVTDLPIAQPQLTAEKLTIIDHQLSEMFSVTDSKFSVLDTDPTEDLPIHSYEAHSYEVVVIED